MRIFQIISIAFFLAVLQFSFIESIEVNLESINHRIKWLTRTSHLPLNIEKRFDDSYKSLDAAYFKWYKYPEKQFINEIENYEESYSYKQTDDKIMLNILKYDKHTHEQLSSYIAIPVAFRSDDSDQNLNFQNDIFTVAFLDRQEIEFETDKNMPTIDFYCNVSVILPYADLTINKINIDLIQKHLDLKMGILGPEKMKLNKLGKQVYTYYTMFNTILSNL